MKLVYLLFLSFLCSGALYSQIEDLIQPIRLTAGESDSILISDIYFADNYNAEFRSSENVGAEYIPGSKKLVLTPSENFKVTELIPFTIDGKNYVIPVIPEDKIKQSFSYKPGGNPEHVNLFGTFNGWNREAQPMHDEDNDGVYETAILAEPGRYEYKFFVDGKEIVDPANPLKLPNGMGDFNSIIDIISPDTVKVFLHKLNFADRGDNVVLTFALSYLNNNKMPELNESDITSLVGNGLLPSTAVSVAKNKVNISVDKAMLDGHKVFRVFVNKDGRSSNIQTVFLNDGKPVTAEDHHFHQGNIIYSLMIDRFYDGDKSNNNPVIHPELKDKVNYMGGDLQGLTDKINSGYFDSLGINTLWLSPVIQNTDSAYREFPEPHRWFTGYHGYWPTHPTNVEERFGDMQLLKELVNIAHQKGIKILLDYVAHHVHIEHPYWEEHREWFGKLELPDGRKNLRLWDEQRLTTWFEPFMPSFDFLSSKAALDTMTDNALWWLKETGVDGFRHDAVKHVPNEFWRMLTYKIKNDSTLSDRNIYQIGETFGSYDLISSYVNNGQLDAQFNFNLYDAATPAILDTAFTFETFDAQMQKTFAVYGVNNTMGNIMDSHDKVRFMALADGDLVSGDPIEIGWDNPPAVDNQSSYDKLKLYQAYLLTTPGIPVIYYGDEFGMTGAADPDNRRMMRFGDELTDAEKQTLQNIRKIVNIRNVHSALKYGDFLTLKAEGNIYAYLRSDFNERILVVLNKADKPEQMKIELPAEYTTNEAVDLVSGERFLVNNSNLYINIPALGYRIFTIKQQ